MFGNRRNFRRHNNQFHNQNAKIVRYSQCDRHFFRREHLREHLKFVHGFGSGKSYEIAIDTGFEYCNRNDLSGTSDTYRNTREDDSNNKRKESVVKDNVMGACSKDCPTVIELILLALIQKKD